MIQRLLIAVVILTGLTTQAQNRTTSPYSYFGLGQQTFRGTVENRSMAGMSTYLDSIHTTIQNPATYGKVRLVNYGIGLSYTSTYTSDNTNKDSSSSASIEYLNITIPVSPKAGFGFGLVPFKSVGYELGEITTTTYTRFTGTGDLNRVYLAAGAQIFKGLSIGAEYRYIFGNEQNSSSVAFSDVALGTNEINTAEFTGSSYNVGLNYSTTINSDKDLQISATYAPETTLSVEGNRLLSTFTLTQNAAETPVEIGELESNKQKVILPQEFTVGISYGQQLKWSLGAEYSNRKSSAVIARTFAPANNTFIDASSVRLGGFYIPDYNSISSYWRRVTYRAGARYEGTGININGTDINEFGITFGMGLPVGPRSGFTNVNVGLEFGQIGTDKNNLVKENFIGLSVGLSFNDKWFGKRKYY